MTRTRTIWLLASSVVVAGAVLAAQAPQAPPPAEPPSTQPPPLAEPRSTQPPVTFRAEVNYVEVDARVLDAKGGFVPGLTEADFQVLRGRQAAEGRRRSRS